MKNRVLRSALAVILVIAMVLTMAACGDSTTEDVVTTTTPAATAAPAATETPVAPTEAPVVTTAPTVAPTTSAEQDTIADDFGITLTAVDGTYGTDAKNADGDKIKSDDKYNNNSTTSFLSSPYGYYLLSIDEDLINDQDYTIAITYGNVNIYSDNGTYKWVGGTTTYASANAAEEGLQVEFAFSDYDGDSTATKGYIYFVDEDEIYILFKEAGEYELELEVVIEDKYQDYGAWDNDDRDEFETTLTSVLTIAKQSVAISFDPIVVKVDEDSELIVDDATTAKVDSPTTGTAEHYFENGEVVVLDGNGTSTFGTSYGTFAPSKTILPNGYSYEYSIDYTEETAVGTYAVSVAIVQGGDEVDLDDINEELPNHIITSVADAEIYVVSAYDWNEIRDVVTSISEITADVYKDTTTLTSKLEDYTDSFTDKDDAVLKNVEEDQLALAFARYNALSTEQQAFFSTGYVYSTTYASINADAPANELAVENWIAEDGNKSVNTAVGYYKFMSACQDVVDLQVVIDAFDDIADDIDFTNYFTVNTLFVVNGYYTSNASAITAFNYVDAYWNALSEDDQEDIEDSYGEFSASTSYYLGHATTADSNIYHLYMYAKDAFDNAEVTAVQELIVGAYNAYVKAVDNGATPIYSYSDSDDANFTEWVYINSSEVISLTSQAQAAFDALTDDQQDILDDDTNSTNGLVTGHIDSNSKGTISLVSDEVTFKEVLDQLTGMNEMVETMITISEYVNISDYSTDGVVYTRLLALVYGTEYATYDSGSPAIDALQGMFFATYNVADAGVSQLSTATDANGDEHNTDTSSSNYYDYRFAMQDIIDAPTRNYDAIIAEYQAWIDFVLYLEDYKADLVDAFKDGVADAIAELDTEDYDASVLSVASSMSNDFAEAIIEAIETEDSAAVTVPTKVGSTFETSVTATTGLIVKAGFLSGLDSIEEIMEELEDFCDIEDVIDSYIDSIKE
ncbi:MAG: hypothetical protein R3Y65_09105 [Bacillota bacterium]